METANFEEDKYYVKKHQLGKPIINLRVHLHAKIDSHYEDADVHVLAYFIPEKYWCYKAILGDVHFYEQDGIKYILGL